MSGFGAEPSDYMSVTSVVLTECVFHVCVTVGLPVCLSVCLCKHLPLSPCSDKSYPLILQQLLYSTSHVAITDVCSTVINDLQSANVTFH